MNKHIKKLLSLSLSAAMMASAAVMPVAHAEGTAWNADAGSWKFDFGAADSVADGYIGVSADMQYTADRGYGFLGLENGFATDWLADGYEMTQGYDLTLENGKRENVSTADDDFVACTYDETVGNTGMVSPIRFAMKSPESTYYTVKIKMQRADASKEAKVTLTTERRHQHLLGADIPEEGLEYECSVYVHNWWDKNGGEKHDTTLNIVALGENVAVSSIEVTKQAAGKTLFVLTDSTGCEQSTAIPYFPLNRCQGVGSAMAKYLGKDWALVNEGQSGLSASASANHFNNCKDHIKAGDVVWFEFGHNDDKVTNDPATNGYNNTLESYYKTVTDKGASFVVVSPIERKMQDQYQTDGTWTHTLNHYSTAGKAFVDAKIAKGATNIAFVDVNEMSLDFLNKVTEEINKTCDYGWVAPNFYYFLNDYTHPNDYGADNFAYLFVKGANDIIDAAKAENAEAGTKAQAAVLSSLLEGQRSQTPNKVPEEIYSLGKVPNSAYPSALTRVVYYNFPWLLKNVKWNDDGTAKSVTAAPVACDKEIPSLYSKGVIEVFDKDGASKGKITTADFLDKLNGEGTLEFTDTTVKFDADAGDTYNAYMIDSDIGVTGETVVSNTLTEKDNYDIKAYLMQGVSGQENIEDFSTYTDLAAGDTVNKGGWGADGSIKAVLAEENGVKFAQVSREGDRGMYFHKKLTENVSTGQVLVQMDVRYHEGVMNFEFTDGSKNPGSFPPLILPVVIKSEDSEAGVYLDGERVSPINAGEWVTIQYVIDLDYGTHTLKVNGQEKTKDIPQMQKNEANVPSQLGAIAFVETAKVTTKYDLTNIMIASLNVPELPQKTISAKAIAGEGTIALADGGNNVVSLPAQRTMNEFLTLNAVPNKGYKFVSWNDAETDAAISYNESYKFRLHSDMDVYAEFIATAEPDMIFNLEGNGTVDEYIVGSANKTNGMWTATPSGNYAFMTPATSKIKYLNLTGMKDYKGQFYLFANNEAGKNSTFTAKKDDMTVEGAGIFKFAIAPVADYSNEGTKHRGTDNVSVALQNESGEDALTVAYTASDFTLAVNGETVHTFKDAKAAQNWTAVKAEINADHTKANVTLTYTDGSEATVKEVALAKTGKYNSFKVTANGWGAVGIDEIQLYEGNEYIPSDDLAIDMKYIAEDGKVKISSNKKMKATLIAASYDKTTKALVKTSVKKVDLADGVIRVGAEIAENCDVKLMLWDSLNSENGMKPVWSSVTYSAAE